LQSFLLKIDVAEIIVHKADQPNTVVDLFDAHGLTGERGTEIYFLFENDPTAVGHQSCAIVERVGGIGSGIPSTLSQELPRESVAKCAKL
jgi:hypothetical protein